jgi:hypothetical protein
MKRVFLILSSTLVAVSAPLVSIGLPSHTLAAPTKDLSIEDTSKIPKSITSVTFVPANTAAVFAINTTTTNWGRLNRFNPLPFSISGPMSLPYIPVGINFATQVQPWISDWALVALLPPGEGETATFQEQAFMVSGIRDREAAMDFIENLRSLRTEAPQQRTYKGVQLWQWQAEPVPICDPESSQPQAPDCILPPAEEMPPSPDNSQEKSLGQLDNLRDLPFPEEQSPSNSPQEETEPPTPMRPSLSVAIAKDYMVLSSRSQAIEQFVNDQNNTSSLAQNSQFRKLLQADGFHQSLGFFYINSSELSQWFPRLSEKTSDRFSFLNLFWSGLQPVLETYNSFDGMAWITGEGARIQSRAFYREPKSENAALTSPKTRTVLNILPGSTYLAASIYNFPQQLARSMEIAREQPFWQLFMQQMGTIRPQQIEEAIAWMDGSIAFFVFPTEQGLFPTFDPRLQLGIGAIVETSDRTTAETRLQQLATVFTNRPQSQLQLVSQNIDRDRTLISWERVNGENAQSVVAYTWRDDRTLLIASGSSALEELMSAPLTSLGEAYNFQQAIQPFPDPNSGYFFLNMGSVLTLANKFLPEEANASFPAAFFLEFIRGIRSISGSILYAENWEQSDFFIRMAPVQKAENSLSGSQETR